MKRKIFSIFFALVLVLSFSLVTAVPVAAVTPPHDRTTAITKAADWLAANQNPDGGFAFQFTEPAGDSDTNVLGITAMGILKAHEIEASPGYETALAKAYKYAVLVQGEPDYTWDGNKYIEFDFHPGDPDIYFLVWLAEAAANDPSLLFEINTQVPDTTPADIAGLARTRWDNKVLYLGSTQESPLNGTATGYAEWERARRHGPNYDALIPWNLEFMVKATLALNTYYPGQGYDTQALDIATVIYNSVNDMGGTYFSSIDPTQEWYIHGLTGAIEAFEEAGVYLEKARELTDILIGLQQADGSWDYLGSIVGKWCVDNTAYAVMALLRQGHDDGVLAAQKGADWLVLSQEESGGWFAEGGAGGEWLEVDSEAAWALASVSAPVTIGTKEYYSIQSAIDAASPHDTINVAAGTYTENLVFDGDEADNITIQGATGVADDVILNGYVHFDGSTTGLTFDTMKFKAEAAYPESPPAVLFRTDEGSQESLTVNNCHIVKGETAGSVFDAYGNQICDNFEFTGNTVEDFADAHWGVLYFQVQGDPVNTGWKINDNDFINCGGAAIIAMDQNGIEIKNNTIDYSDVSMNNMTCGAIQAALLTHPSPSDPQPITIEGNTVIGPGRDWKGGSTGTKFAAIAIYGFESGASATIGDNTVTDSYRGIVLTKASNVGISDNDITDCGAGISFGGECSGINVSGNNLSSNDIGILFPSSPMEGGSSYANPAGDNVFHFNNIVNNDSGVLNEISTIVDATNNWWGDISGPEHKAASFEDWPNNPGGTGNAVSDNVHYAPWLTRDFQTVLDDNIGYFGIPMVYLNTGWNTFSTPIALDGVVEWVDSDDISRTGVNTWGEYQALGDGLNVVEPPVVSAYRYDAGASTPHFVPLVSTDPLTPCDAIYVRMAEPDIAAILYSPETSAPTKEVYPGWNLVGLAWLPTETDEGMPVEDALTSLYMTPGDYTGYSQVVSPPFNQPSWTFFRDGDSKLMYPTWGYWVFMENGPDTLAGLTFTPMSLTGGAPPAPPPPPGLVTEVPFQWYPVTEGSAYYSESWDDESFTYTLPWTFPFAGKDIVEIEVTSNGLIELLESEETSEVTSSYDYMISLAGDYPESDIIFAWNDDLDSGTYGFYGVEYDSDNDVVVVHWETETNDDESETVTPECNYFQLWLFPDGSIKWNFKEFNYVLYGYDLGTGIYDSTTMDLFNVAYAMGEPDQIFNTPEKSYEISGEYMP